MLEKWPTELHVCAQLCRRHDGPVTTEAPIDWPKLRDLAHDQGVEAIVGGALSQQAHLSVPEDILDWFRQAIHMQELQSLRVQAAVLKAVQDLEASEIPCLLLKGPAIAERYYEHPAFRQVSDVDLLIAESDVVRARQVLARAGYRLDSPEAPSLSVSYGSAFTRLAGAIAYVHPGLQVPIDLHWQAIRPHGYGLTYSRLENHLEELRLGGHSLRVLRNSVQFLYLIYHGAKHGWSRLKWLADLDRITPYLSAQDIQEAWQLARADRAEHIVTASLQFYGTVFARDLTQLGIETNSQNDKTPSKLCRYMESAILAKPFDEMSLVEKLRSRLAEYRYHLGWGGTFGARWFLVTRLLASRNHVRLLRLGERWLWVYVVAGPFLRVLTFLERRWSEHLPRNN